MILLILLFSYDSMPPVPDLSNVIFPEPPLWIEPGDNFFALNGHFGNFNAGNCDFRLQRLNITAQYEKKNEWDSIELGSFKGSYSLPLPHFWLKPSISGEIFQRDNKKYKLLSPNLELSSTLSRAVILGDLNYDLWQIDQRNYFEEDLRIGIIFDQMIYLPHIEISQNYTAGGLRLGFTGKLHIHNLHLGIGFLIFDDFPSPYFEVGYLNPKIKIESRIKRGSSFHRLRDFFRPDIPIVYNSGVPDESLKIDIGTEFKYELHHHCFSLKTSYKDWARRLVVGPDFEITKAFDVQETNTAMLLKNKFRLKSANLSKLVAVGHNWADVEIPFLPRYYLLDTLKLNYQFIEFSTTLRYLSQRNGIDKALYSCITINSTMGLRYKNFTTFIVVSNLTDEKKEIYDSYLLSGRQYAIGLKFIVKIW